MRKPSVRLIMSLIITLMVLQLPVPPSAQRCGGDFSVSMERGVIGIGLQGTTYTQCVSACSQLDHERVRPNSPNWNRWVRLRGLSLLGDRVCAHLPVHTVSAR